MNRSTTFLLSFAFTMVGAALDYLIGRLANSPSLGIGGGAAGMAIAAVALDFSRESRRETHDIVMTSGGYAHVFRTTRLHELHRGADAFRWGTMVNAVFAAVFAWVATYIFILATLTIRYTNVLNGFVLGKSSPFDNSVVTFVSEFQVSPPMLWFTLACFFLAVFIRPSSVVPLSVIAVSVANAASLPLKHVVPRAAGPQTQFLQTVAVPDQRFFQIPDNYIVLGCMAAYFAGLLLCGLIHLILDSTGQRRR